jgi:hypothetical protein
VLALTASDNPALAQAGRPDGSATKPQRETAAQFSKEPMLFYFAKGDPNACGQDCDEWIAAEGYVDSGAPQRLRDVLNRSAKRGLPIFFHSPGGLDLPAMAIGRLLHERGMTAGVSRTIPAACTAAVSDVDASCGALKRAGQVVPSELHNVAGCSSACVFALIGAKVRKVPPGARLGVHSGDASGFAREKRETFLRESVARIRRYHQEMQIDAGLLEVVAKIPSEQLYFLSRDEIVGFGIDAREFQETRWIALERPQRPVEVVKFLLEAKGTSPKEYRVSLIRLGCASPGRLWIGYYRGLGWNETGIPRAIKLSMGDRSASFPKATSISKLDWIDTGGSFESRATYEPLEFFEAATTQETIDVVESDPASAATSLRITKLSTVGLSRALEPLRKTCGKL